MRKTIKIYKLVPDNRNFNGGTQYGQHLIEESLRKFGAGRSVLLDKNNRIIAGNKTIENAAAIGLEDVIVVETTGDKIVAVKRTDIDLDSKQGREMALADNATAAANLSWDEKALESARADFGIVPTDWGVTIEPMEAAPDIEGGGKDIWDEEDEAEDTPSFYESMVQDVLYASNNEFEIPTLDIGLQAGRVELPITPWGADSRMKTGVNTYHFYVDDYRFSKLWKDPLPLINSGCKAIVEPNLSLHDQTPIAYGLQQIYMKRWLARYMQGLGVRVYVDLNVAPKFAEYNRLGVPEGWDAFFTRGTVEWCDRLDIQYRIAQEISGKREPNFIVYAGGKDIRDYCHKHNILYIEDYINVRKKEVYGDKKE